MRLVVVMARMVLPMRFVVVVARVVVVVVAVDHGGTIILRWSLPLLSP